MQCVVVVVVVVATAFVVEGEKEERIQDVERGEMRAVHHSVETDPSNEEIVETDGPFRNWNARQNFSYIHDEGQVVESSALSENGTDCFGLTRD